MQLDRNQSSFIFTIMITIAILFGIAPTKTHAENKASIMTNSAIGHPATNSRVEDPAAYYAARVKALELVKQKSWQSARPLIESLTNQYPDDGDTWYLLGLTYFQLGQWEKSINAFERTIALGTILSNIPTGSAPSNDIMMNIAEAYSELGQESNAIAWITKSLEARYDGRKDLVSNAHFEQIADSKAFQRVSGNYLPENLSRIQSWQFDLNFLVEEIKRLHINMYHSVSKAKFEQIVSRINDRIPYLSDQEIVFEFMKLVATLGNGHNFIVPAFGKKGSFKQLPLQFYQFSDGLFIVDASQQYRQLVGSKVVAIGNMKVDEALSKVKVINARDNDMQQLWLGPYYLGLAEVLKGLNIVNDAEDITLTIKDNEGKQRVIKPTLKAMTFSGFPKLPALAKSSAIHNLKIKEQYWYKHVPEKSALYIQYNYVHNNPSRSFEDFNQELREKASKLNIQNLILDIRHNAGGNGSIYPPILKTLVQFEALRSQGKIFVIIGRNTFSAAHNLLLDISRLTNAVIVGEPSGSRPNALGEAGWFKLPYSGTLGIISSQFHQASKAEDHRIWVAPHVPVNLSSVEYFSGEDPALNVIFKIISNQASTK
ncbi:S41 family peptidase [Pleionea sp. CnH1-48]|uniref:S41 family peptidase n=1 Tax=Pleionea sp. CnH1-48 TaxID=2954494 RepID=UPI0020973B5F|nr:tetratricopeptide repeat protein [Pleionea sp. CnH1-48]MCO7224406.1 tetratricopeptide repeat protein [Pleionea sp. CnH1-48]